MVRGPGVEPGRSSQSLLTRAALDLCAGGRFQPELADARGSARVGGRGRDGRVSGMILPELADARGSGSISKLNGIYGVRSPFVCDRGAGQGAEVQG